MKKFIALYCSFSDEEKNLETQILGVFSAFKEANEMARDYFLSDKKELYQGCTATENKETGVYKLSDDYLNIHEMIEVKEIKVN